VRFGERAVALREFVQQYHAGAAGAPDHRASHDPRDEAPRLAPDLAENDLAPDV
jgi:hypothetical protein